jgi:hypothetical protein
MADGPHPISADMAPLMAAIDRAREASLARPRRPDPELDSAMDRAHKATVLGERIRELMAYGIPEDAAEVIAAGKVASQRDGKPVPSVDAVIRLVEAVRQGRKVRRLTVLAGQKDASKTMAASLAVATWPQGHPTVSPRLAWYQLHEAPHLVPFAQIIHPWFHESTPDRPVDDVLGLTKRRLFTARLLVLDDVGQEPSTTEKQAGVFEEALDQLLETRASLGLVTLLTTNYHTLTDRCDGCSRMPEKCDADRERHRGPDSDGLCTCHGYHFETCDRRRRRLDVKARGERVHLRDGLLSRYPRRGQRIQERIIEHAGEAGWVECPHSGYRRRKAPQKESE